jgi:hypothetical protein
MSGRHMTDASSFGSVTSKTETKSVKRRVPGKERRLGNTVIALRTMTNAENTRLDCVSVDPMISLLTFKGNRHRNEVDNDHR